MRVLAGVRTGRCVGTRGLFTRARFSTPLRDYRAFGPLHLAGYGEARWHLSDGEFTYGEFTMQDIVHNDGQPLTRPR